MSGLHFVRTGIPDTPKTPLSAFSFHEYYSDTPRHHPDIPKTTPRHLQGTQDVNRRQYAPTDTSEHTQKHLSVSEYKVSRAIRSGSRAANFNHYVNGFRLSHAKRLLLEPDSHDWTILVISLESGFASLAPFNRSFKAQEGCTPNQYRRRHTDWCSKEDIKVNRA